MNLDIEKVQEYIERHGNRAWSDIFFSGELKDENVEETDNGYVFRRGKETLSFSVNDNVVEMIHDTPPDYDDERSTITEQYIYNDDSVLFKIHIDSEYYADVRPEKGKDIPLRHNIRNHQIDYSVDQIMPINELYTPSKKK